MRPDRFAIAPVLAWYKGRGLVSAAEVAQAMACFAADEDPFASAAGPVQGVHLHIVVEDLTRLPHDAITAGGGLAEDAGDGAIRYAHPGGLTMTFSVSGTVRTEPTGCGGLTPREKALIALALAHACASPTAIAAATRACREAGARAAEMREAAALAADGDYFAGDRNRS